MVPGSWNLLTASGIYAQEYRNGGCKSSLTLNAPGSWYLTMAVALQGVSTLCIWKGNV